MENKQAIRNHFIHIRKNCSFHLDVLESIFTKFLKLLSCIPEVKSIGVYHPTKTELDILPLINRLNEHQILYPKVTSNHDMIFCSSKLGMSKSFNHSFFEPNSVIEYIPEIIILPLVTCDLKGNRIGYGKGFYDRYLSKNHIKHKIALIPEELVCLQDIASEPHDVPLDYIITENRVFSTSQGRNLI